MSIKTVSEGVSEKEYARNQDGLVLVPCSYVITVRGLEALWLQLDKEDKSVILVEVKGSRSPLELARLWRISAAGVIDGLAPRPCAKIGDLATYLKEKAEKAKQAEKTEKVSQAFLIVDGRGSQKNNINQGTVRTSLSPRQVMRGTQARVKPPGLGDAVADCPPLAVLSALDWEPTV